MEKIYNYSAKTLGVVHTSEIKIGDQFRDGYNSVDKIQIWKQVTNIHEQRKERGVLINEANRRQWGKVDVILCPPPEQPK